MSVLPGCSGAFARFAKKLCHSSITVSSRIRAASLTSAARDESNVLSSTITQPLSEKFQQNASALSAVLEELYGKVSRVCEGGGAKAVERHRSRNKLLPRERIAALLDPGSPFLELSQLAGFNLYGQCRFPAFNEPSTICVTSHATDVAPLALYTASEMCIPLSSEQGCFWLCVLPGSLHAISRRSYLYVY